MSSTTENYELWESNDFLGVYRDTLKEPLYWMQWFPNMAETSTDGYIDFEKMPIRARHLAPFVLPMGRGKSIFADTSTAYRFKPAYIKLEDTIDPVTPLRRMAGIDPQMSQRLAQLTPMERIGLLRAQITMEHEKAIRRTFNYMAAVALRDGQITLEGPDYPTTLLDFQRAAGHTITLGSGNRFGDVGVSIVDFFQLVIDTMTASPFGAMPVRATMGGGVWGKIRKDAEFLDHMDLQIRGASITITRGLTPGAGGVSGELLYKVGEMTVGGGSGQVIELWVDNSTFKHPVTGTETRYIGNHQVLFTGTAEAVNGYQAFGAIVSRAAEYAVLPYFGQNWLGPKPHETEYIAHDSAPLMVPINPNATLLANVIAP